MATTNQSETSSNDDDLISQLKEDTELMQSANTFEVVGPNTVEVSYFGSAETNYFDSEEIESVREADGWELHDRNSREPLTIEQRTDDIESVVEEIRHLRSVSYYDDELTLRMTGQLYGRHVRALRERGYELKWIDGRDYGYEAYFVR